MALKTCIGFCIVSTLFLVGFLGCETPQSSVTGSGIVEATDIIISAVLAEEITMLDVNEGDTVSAGQIIARQDKQALELERAATEAMRSEIDALEIQATAKVSHAQTALKGAEKDYKRALSLKQKGSIPQQQFDQVETAYELAQEQLRMAKSVFQSFDARRKTVQAKLDLIDYRISKTEIDVPINGIVLEKFLETGEHPIPGKPIIQVADLSRVWVRIFIPETDLGIISIGSKAMIIPDSQPDKPIYGSVTWIAEEAEFTPKNIQTRDARADLVYAVKISAPNPDGILKIGMPVDAVVEGFPEYDRYR